MAKLTEALVLAKSRASDLENVRKLNCWGSYLADVTVLRQMPNVHIVSLSVNQITTLADLAYCENLEELYIRKNNISNLAEICYLRHLPKLRNLWLADNPCAVGDHYRMTVLKTLPNLHKLDNVVVSEDEINTAIEHGLELSMPGAGDPGAAEVTREVITESAASDVTPAAIQQPTAGAVGNDEKAMTSSESAVNGAQCLSPADSAIRISWEETNKIRAQLGLKQLPVEKVTPMKPRTSYNAKSRNANVLQAVLHLIKELDMDSLEVVADAVRNRMDAC